MQGTVENKNTALALRWGERGGSLGLRKLGAVVERFVTLYKKRTLRNRVLRGSSLEENVEIAPDIFANRNKCNNFNN